MSDELERIFNDSEEPIAETQEPEVEAPEPEKVERDDGRDEKGRFASKGEKEDGASPASGEAEPELDHKALLGERRRRQEAEAKYSELEQRLAQIEQAKQQQAEAPQEIDDDLMFSDPARYRALMAENIRREVLREAQGLTEQTALTTRMDTSEMLARSRYDDFDDALVKFREMASANPYLTQQLRGQADPAEWAYRQVKEQELVGQVREAGSLDKLKEQLRAELAAERPSNPTIPETLADAPASRAGAGGVAAPSVSFEDLFKR